MIHHCKAFPEVFLIVNAQEKYQLIATESSLIIAGAIAQIKVSNRNYHIKRNKCYLNRNCFGFKSKWRWENVKIVFKFSSFLLFASFD